MKFLRRLQVVLALLVLGAAAARAENCTGNEAWVPVGDAPTLGMGRASVVFDGSLYVIGQETTGQWEHFVMRAWNGSVWSEVSKFDLTGSYMAQLTLVEYKGDLYLAGGFSSMNNVPGTQGIVRWNGTAWEAVDGGVSGMIHSALVYRDELYVGGDLTQVGSTGARTLARYDGTSWKEMDEEPSGVVMALGVHNDELFAIGVFEKIGASLQVSNAAIYDGTNWRKGGTLTGHNSIRLKEFDGEIYSIGMSWINSERNTASIAMFDGTEWQELNPPFGTPYGSAEVLDGKLYVMGPMGLKGRDTILSDSARGAGVSMWDGTNWTQLSGFNKDSYQGYLTAYNGELYAVGDFTSSCGTPLGGVARLCTKENCNSVAGTLFQDVDGDCAYDAGEEVYRNRMIEILPGPHYAITDKNGNYSRVLGNGEYTVSLVPHKYWNLTCPVGGSHTATLSQPGQGLTGLNFAISPIAGIRDLRVSIAGGRPRPGFAYTYVIHYENAGTEALTGTIRLTHDPVLVHDSSVVAPTRYSPGVAEWDFAKLPVGETGVIYVYMRVPAETPLGTKVCAILDVDLDGPVDEVLRDNTDSLCEEVRGSYDPNDISVTPLGDLEDELYRLKATDTVLSYMIRFQNTGTDTAFTVVVVDTLDMTRLNVTTLTPGASSHPYTLDITPEGALRFTFKDIMLPDSNVNEVASHGYLKYRVHLKGGIEPDAEIANRAAIYFDYNSPVITNTVVSITQGTSSSVPEGPAVRAEAVVYPNPVKGKMYIEAEMERGAQAVLSTMLGAEAGRWESDGSSRMAVDVAGLPSGVYLLRVETRNGTAVTRLNIVR